MKGSVPQGILGSEEMAEKNWWCSQWDVGDGEEEALKGDERRRN